MADARSRNLQTDTVKKLERLFEKQFLPWIKSEGLVYLDELDHNALLTYRTTWTEGMMVKAKKQDRIVGFFWECFRRGFITQNPALSLSKIRPKHIPTDYFPKDEFHRIIDAIVIYGDPRGGYLGPERLADATLLGDGLECPERPERARRDCELCHRGADARRGYRTSSDDGIRRVPATVPAVALDRRKSC